MAISNPDLAPVASGENVRQSVPVIDLGGRTGMRDPATIERVAGAKGPFAGTTPWPTAQSEFRAVLQAHFRLCEGLANEMMEAVCLSLGLPKDRASDCFAPHLTSFLRLNYYPVDDPLSDVPATMNEAAGLGIYHHSDAGAVTVLMQDAVSGLQVFKDGYWHAVQPVEGAFVINNGDMAQISDYTSV